MDKRSPADTPGSAATATTGSTPTPPDPRCTRVIRQHGVSWERTYGYAQAVRVGDVIYVSGQLSHDERGVLVAPAPLNEAGQIAAYDRMEAQMRQSYANAARLLQQFGATLADVVDETLYVIDVDAAFAVAGRVRKHVYGADVPPVASTLVGTTRLAFREQLIEIRMIAVLPGPPATS
jgi:enamine deaminase RidA (YjgF/YER057c/UK114 family)